ncbi:polysaccharide pyruvyl transferase family protein [Ruegeria arenilitoris]|uniref:polysaccharide pyruvyl transferase family protein n=1 Tax=Ruegeria arenilitoris TaxID=1173585 RepID=UPI00147F1A0C|nr:polysaccharide pyruvyl transferase family protein [Ruegeria arenilitoris]
MPRLLHIGIHNSKNKNAGDTVLFPVVRALFEDQVPDCTWDYRQLWDPFTLNDAKVANENYDGIVIGGGGLLLRDQAGSDTSNSGWQWNSEIAAVEALRVPVYFFAVGYNRFRGQEDFDPVFAEHIAATLRASAFFGLRNHGSIAAVKSYVPTKLAERICLQQCPTTVIWQLYPDARQVVETRPANKRPILTLNTAFDRETLRFGETKVAALETIARSMKRAEDKGWQIQLVAHKTKDLEVAPYLVEKGVAFDTFDLTEAGYRDVIDYYTQPDLVVGMRGHAQMIPFGMRCPIFSIISHNKMRFFLDDIGHPEWGHDIGDPQFSETLDAFIDQAACNPASLRQSVAEAQTLCWERSLANMQTIARSLAT